MAKAKLQAATVGGSADDIEAAFYDALQKGDIQSMMRCWADEDDVVCVHPGGPRLVGIGAVRANFEALFANGGVPAYPHKVRRVVSLASAMHSVIERVNVPSDEPGGGVQHAFVLATNVYHKTAQGWRMVCHHASPGTQSEMLELAETRSLLH
jgi:ketosteroid isomerase-like protein